MTTATKELSTACMCPKQSCVLSSIKEYDHILQHFKQTSYQRDVKFTHEDQSTTIMDQDCSLYTVFILHSLNPYMCVLRERKKEHHGKMSKLNIAS